MNLQEKIQTILIEDSGNLQKICFMEDLADEFAIDFAIFSKDYSYHSSHKIWVDSFNLLGERFTSQELKDKFKKEKGL